MRFLQCIARIPSTRVLHRPALCVREYADNATSKPKAADTSKTSETQTEALSSCPENMVLTGLNWLKDQPPVLALPDKDYPPWLWNLLNPRVYPDDGPGGKGEKMLRRKENRQRIRDQNFLKTQ